MKKMKSDQENEICAFGNTLILLVLYKNDKLGVQLIKMNRLSSVANSYTDLNLFMDSVS